MNLIILLSLLAFDDNKPLKDDLALTKQLREQIVKRSKESATS